jgi:hypothetical protein
MARAEDYLGECRGELSLDSWKLTGCPLSRGPWLPGYPPKWSRSGGRISLQYEDWMYVIEPCLANLDQDALLVDALFLVQSNDLTGLGLGGVCGVSSSTAVQANINVDGDPPVHDSSGRGGHVGWRRHSPASNEKLASSSVETRPGTILRISVPNPTSNLSMAFWACCSRLPPFCLP